MKKIKILMLCVMTSVVFLYGCATTDNHPSGESAVSEETSVNDHALQENMNEEEEAPEELITDGSAQGYFTATDIYGNTVTQGIFTESKLTMVNVWATYCTPCINEMPDLAELAEEYEDSEFQVIGIPVDATTDRLYDCALRQIDETGADYTHLIPSEELYEWGLEEVQYVPTTYFVNSEGEIIDTVIGAFSKAYWVDFINEKLASL